MVVVYVYTTIESELQLTLYKVLAQETQLAIYYTVHVYLQQLNE